MLSLRARAALLWLAGLLLVAPAAQALDKDKAFHHYVRDSWSIEDGLPQITVRAITQDRDGYLWFGTQAGVARFDGVRFTTFSTANTPELPGTYINALLADPQGRVWIGTYKGLAVHEQGTFRHLPAEAASGALDIQHLIRTDAGEILAATPQGVYQVVDDRLVRQHALPGPAQVLLGDADALWVGSLGGVYRIEGVQNRFLPLPEDASSAIVTQLHAAQGHLWAATGIGLFWLVDGQWQRYDLDAALARAPIEELYSDRDGNLWIAMLDHLLRLHDGKVIERIQRLPSGLAVRSAFEDREGNLWLGTQWDGVIRLWNGWTRRYSGMEGLHDPIVWSVARGADDSLWVGTETGLAKFERGRYQLVVPGHALPHPNAYTLLVEPEQVWIGTRGGVAVLGPEGLSTPEVLAPLASAQINGILRGPRDALWFATTQGLFRLTGDLLVRFGTAEGLPDPRIRLISQTRDQRLLVGGQSGLFEFRDERLYPVGLESGLHAGLDVTAVHELADGRLVIGTMSEGVFLFDGKRWLSLSREAGLPSYAPFFITDDGTDYLWVAGIRGIYRVSLRELDALAKGETHRIRGEMRLNERGERRGGQKGFCCNGAGLAKGLIEDGVLWLPSRDGVVALSTREAARNNVAPNARVERVQVQGQWRDANPALDWTLPQDARDLSFEFTTLSFQDPRSVDLRYRLRGYDLEWHTLDDPTRRSATYTNLPPGHYQFEVSGSNNTDVWSPEPAQFEFRILPRFQETSLFLFLLALLLASVIYGGFRQQLAAHRRQRAALEQLVRERTEALEVSNRRLEEASQIDALTGLRNRRFLANQLPADIAYYERERSRHERLPETLVFALVSIDQLERITAQGGETSGEHLLQQLAGVIGRWLRSGDYIARWSEHEFLIVFRPLPMQHLPALGHRLCHAISQQAFEPAPGQAQPLSCSIGLIECPLSRDARGRLGWEHFVELAGRAMNWVRQHGGNGWAALQPKPGRDLDRLRLSLQEDFAAALQQEQVELHCSEHLRLPDNRGR